MRSILGFLRREDGGLSVEFVVLFPFLILLYGAMFVFWDAFETMGVTVRATETVADLMSRETGAFDAAYLAGMHEVFDWLTSADAPTAMRVTAVATEVDADGAESFAVLWSEATGRDVPDLDPAALEVRVPEPALGEELLVVETFYTFTPLADLGLAQQEFGNLVATRPRYVPQLLWSGS